MNRKTIKDVATRLADLNFSSENAQIADMRADIERMESAIRKAEERCAELTQAKVMGSGPDARAVADALLADVAPIDAAARTTASEDIDAELASLRAGIRDLRRRIDDTNRAIPAIENIAKTRVSDVVQPLVEDILADVRQAGEQIREAYAALTAVADAARVTFRDQGTLRNVAEALTRGDRRLLRYSREIEVPADVADALSNLAGKGAAHRPYLTRSVPTP